MAVFHYRALQSDGKIAEGQIEAGGRQEAFQAVKVKLLGFDDRGKVRLSMKQVDQATGEDLAKKPAEAKAEAPQA